MVNVLDKALASEGLELQGDNTLPLEHRKVRVFRRLINAVRAAENECQGSDDELKLKLAHVQDELNEANKTIQRMTVAVEKLQSELRCHKVAAVAESFDLTRNDKQKLIESANA